MPSFFFVKVKNNVQKNSISTRRCKTIPALSFLSLLEKIQQKQTEQMDG